MPVPAPDWLNSGDTAWQLTAATLVGIMSIPGLAILYAGLMKKKWAVNSSIMVVYAFAMTLVIWMLFAYRMSFGDPAHLGPGFLGSSVGIPKPVAGADELNAQASIPLLSGLIPNLRFPLSSLVYFQFVFAAITVIILGGALLGRISFRAWALFVPLWIALVYSVGAFSIWGGGWLSQDGAVDYSGGYVIHVAAAVSAFVAAAVVGPRLVADRLHNKPSNLMLAVAGGGLLWLGWSGFNGGDPYFANVNASAAVLNTHLCTATALLTWMTLDVFVFKKASVAGMINGMIAGLVAITPGAGFVTGFGAIILGLIAGTVPWITINYLTRIRPFSRVDDTLGVLHTHGFAGAIGGLMTGVMASPNMVQYLGSPASGSAGGANPVSVTGLIYGNPHQLVVQMGALGFIIAYDSIATFLIIKFVGLIVPLRMSDRELTHGDHHVHGEEAFDVTPHPVELTGHHETPASTPDLSPAPVGGS
ncbi:MAG TPA: ammonium transporter [Candidatus Dormibacteraeota bacterium]|nr:ammonium transporter [Candidatus Dormibacteraeota bacterium]